MQSLAVVVAIQKATTSFAQSLSWLPTVATVRGDVYNCKLEMHIFMGARRQALSIRVRDKVAQCPLRQRVYPSFLAQDRFGANGVESLTQSSHSFLPLDNSFDIVDRGVPKDVDLKFIPSHVINEYSEELVHVLRSHRLC